MHPSLRLQLREADIDPEIGPTSPGQWRAFLASVAATYRSSDEVQIERQQGQKLEAVGRLASGLAHEINTPIQYASDSIHYLEASLSALFALNAEHERIFASLPETIAAPLRARLDAANDEADREFVEQEAPVAAARALDGLRRIAGIVSALRTFADPNRTHKQGADLNEALRCTLEIARSQYQHVADVETELSVHLPRVECHLSAVNQVFLNLLVNAAHAIEDRLRERSERGLIQVTSRLEGEHVTIAIADNGGGIPERDRDRIFDPFFTTKEVGRGTGQGLTIARTIIVDHHGGSLTFESSLDTGTTFYVRLPLVSREGQGGTT